MWNPSGKRVLSAITDAWQLSVSRTGDDIDVLSPSDVAREIARLKEIWDNYPPIQQISLRELDSAASIARQLVHLNERSGRFSNAEHWRDLSLHLLDRLIAEQSGPEKAQAYNQRGLLLLRRHVGDVDENLRQATTAFQAALTIYTRETYPVAWAGILNNLGNAWSDMPTGDKADNLRQAIAAYQAALTVRTREANPVSLGWDS